MKLKLELISVVATKNKQPVIIFGCSVNDFISFIPLLEDVSFKFFLESDPSEVLNGILYSVVASSNTKIEEGKEREAICKIKVLVPEIDKIKAAELSTLTGQVLDFELQLSVPEAVAEDPKEY